MPITSPRKLLAIVSVLVAATAACARVEEAGPPVSPEVTVTTEAETVTAEAETETIAPTTTEAGDEDPLRDLIVAPQQPRTVSPGSSVEFTVPGRLGGEDLPHLVGFGWTPCEVVDATEPGQLTFPDADSDGHADQMGESDTGQARLGTVNGEQYENVDEEWPVSLHTREGETPPLRLTMVQTTRDAAGRDCATVVVFIDEDEDEELDLATDRTPSEVYGVGKVTWR